MQLSTDCQKIVAQINAHEDTQSSRSVLAIDPGQYKTGIALVDVQGNCVWLYTVPTAELVALMEAIRFPSSCERIVCGNGTNMQTVISRIEPVGKKRNLSITIVDETNTTVEGRKLYWECNPPKGWRSVLPTNWLTPPQSVDDYTAWIIGKRYWQAS